MLCVEYEAEKADDWKNTDYGDMNARERAYMEQYALKAFVSFLEAVSEQPQ